jgi:hypothetical protein
MFYRPELPGVPESAIRHTPPSRLRRDALIYRFQLSKAHGLDTCEVNVIIPFDPTEPWSGPVNDSEPDTCVEMMAHITLTSLCEDGLATIAALPITLLPIQNQEN